MNIIADNAFSRFLEEYGRSMAKPKAIVVISAHWQTHGTYITSSANPKQIFDFYGFPDALYRIQYAPAGSPEIAQSISQSIPEVRLDDERGIDHAAWALAVRMFPNMDIPLLEISLDVDKSTQEHFELGKALAAFSDTVHFIGSGNVIHNLREISFEEDASPFPWAVESDTWFKEMTEGAKVQDLIQYKETLKHSRRPIPTPEHFLPLLYIMGMKREGDSVRTLFEGMQNASISMRSFTLA